MTAAARLILGLPLLACQEPFTVEVPPAPPRAEAGWQQVSVLGDDPEAGSGALLGHPASVRTAADGTIYVGDRTAAALKVYDGSGRFLRQIGRRGREPGELVDISCFELLPGGQVLVADGVNLRLTRFGAEGELIATHAMDPLEMLWPREVRRLGDGGLLFVYKLPPRDRAGTRRPDARHLLHLYAPDLGTKLAAFARAARLAPGGETADRLLQQVPGRLWVEDDGSVLFAPQLYTGTIHRFSNRQGSWRAVGTLRGYVREAEPYLDATPERLEVEAPTFNIRSSRGRFTGFMRNESRGLFRLTDGRLVHFTLVAEEGGRTFGVEVFDRADRLVSYAVLERVEARAGEATALPVHVEWKDADDRFYIRRHRGERSSLEIARLEIVGAAR